MVVKSFHIIWMTTYTIQTPLVSIRNTFDILLDQNTLTQHFTIQ